MALDFPNSPTVGQLFPTSPAPGTPQFRWDGTAWSSAGIGISSYRLPVYTVAALPVGVAGSEAFASNCRVFNGAGVQEGAAAGTGGLVVHNGIAWKIAGTNVTAIA